MNSIVSVPACVFHTCYRRPSSLHIEFVHTSSSIFTRYLYPKRFLWYHSGFGFMLVPMWLYLLGVICGHSSLFLCEVSLLLSYPLETLLVQFLIWLHGEFTGFLIWCHTCVRWYYPLWYQCRVFFPPLGSHRYVVLVWPE